MNGSAHVRAAGAGDRDAILRVQESSREAPQWSVAHYDEMLQAKPATARRRATFVAETEDKIQGYAVVSVAADEAELESIAVLPEARRQGLARALCNAALAWAASEEAAEMWLEVRSASLGPQALYRQLGFVPMGLRKRYYADPEDDAVLMRANLSEHSHL